MPQENNKPNFSILFVDDEENSAKYFKRIFQQYYNIIATTSPAEALEILEKKSNEIAVIVTDQRMPKKTGVEILTIAKEKYPNIIRILTTAFMNIDENIEAINNSSIAGYIKKPWDVESVKYMLDKALTTFNTNLSLKSLSGSIAHEIRNPLNTVNLSLNQIQEYIIETQNECQTNCLNSQISDMINIAFDSIKRANDLIDKTLQNAQGKEIDKDSFIYLKAQDLIYKVLKEYGYSHKNERKLINLDFTNNNENFIFKGDETLFMFVLFNLLKNSLYYQNYKEDFKINIHISTDSDYNIITIKDNGPGVAKNEQKMIFENFVTSNKKSGTGLGLPFCKRIMESFRGSIECQSVAGEFCEFILKFPALPTEEIAKAKSSLILHENESKLQKHITLQLICQDNVENDKLLNILNKTFPNIIISPIDDMTHIHNNTNLVLVGSSNKINEKPQNILIPTINLRENNAQTSKNFDETININDPNFEKHLIRSICKWNIIDFLPKIKNDTDNKKKNILIADDDQTSLLILKKILTNNHYNVESVINGQDAYDQYLKNKPDLIISDIHMPKLDGTTLCQQIRNHETQNNAQKPVPIICYGGDVATNKIYQYLKEGFSDYFLKGNNTKHLIDLVKFYTT